MSDPNPLFEVVIEDLRSEAKIWDDQVAPLQNAGSTAASLDLNGWSAGLFFAIVDPYNEVQSLVSQLAGQGADEVGRISTALITNANEYERREAEAEVTMQSVEHGY